MLYHWLDAHVIEGINNIIGDFLSTIFMFPFITRCNDEY